MKDEIRAALRNVLGQYPQIKIAYVFGSAARDRVTETSDIDVAVAADTRLSLDTRLELAAQFSQAVRRDVDLIDLQNVSGIILQQSLCRGEVVLQQDSGLHAQLIKRLWFNQADMMPYTRRILAERRKRF
ncbi:MAG: nucleotidyltransferase domain-containing protein [Candidatus Tectomicrobia bacterium]